MAKAIPLVVPLTVKIPNAFTLLGQRYTVKYDETMCAKTNNRGDVSFCYKEVRLQPPTTGEPMPQSMVEQAFFHELTHAILHHAESDLQNDEKFVNLVGSLLHQAIVTAEYDE